MHVHPTVVRLIVEIGSNYGMKAVRLPFEPVETLRAAFPEDHYRTPLYRPWIESLNRRLRHAGLYVNDQLFGLAWSGAMVEERLLRLIPQLPDGVSEIYLHPATEHTPALAAAMCGYCHREELAALVSPALKALIGELDIRLISYGHLADGVC